MYIPAYSSMTEDDAWALMREFPFALLVTAPDGVPFATSVPFTVLEESSKLLTHVAIANPQWRHLQPDLEVLIIFRAEHAFVSSRWYESQPNVPTWNYAIVHAYAKPRILEPEELHAQLEGLMHSYGHAADMTALPADYVDRMQKGIVGIGLDVTRLEGKQKLSQNRTAADQHGVVAQLETQGELEQAVAARMRANLEPQVP